MSKHTFSFLCHGWMSCELYRLTDKRRKMKKRNNIVNLGFLLGFLLLYGVVTFCYSPVFSNGFLDSWDDQWMVMNVFTENGFRMENLMALFTHSYKDQYSPLVELNYMVLYSLFGYDPFWFHLTSLVWHCGCTTLLFFLIRRLLEMSGQSESRRSLRVAALTSFLFAIHPMNVESVAWISAVKVPIYVFFYLSALLLYLRYVRSKELGCYIAALCCFICSGLSKEQALVLPLSLLLIDWFIGHNLKSSDLWIEKLPFFILSAGFALLTLDLQGPRSEAVSYTAVQRLLFGCYSLFEYLTKSLFPINLNYLYPFPILPGGSDIPTRFYVYPMLVAGLFGVLYSFRKKRFLMFGSSFFVIHLLLSLHIVAMPRLGIVADRYLYLSMVGILLLVSYRIISWLEKELRVFPRCSCCFYQCFSIAFILWVILIITVNSGRIRTQ